MTAVKGVIFDCDGVLFDRITSYNVCYTKLLRKAGNVVTGTIVQVNPDSVVVDVGGKSEGLIPISEFLDDNGQVKTDLIV